MEGIVNVGVKLGLTPQLGSSTQRRAHRSGAPRKPRLAWIETPVSPSRRKQPSSGRSCQSAYATPAKSAATAGQNLSFIVRFSNSPLAFSPDFGVRGRCRTGLFHAGARNVKVPIYSFNRPPCVGLDRTAERRGTTARSSTSRLTPARTRRQRESRSDSWYPTRTALPQSRLRPPR